MDALPELGVFDISMTRLPSDPEVDLTLLSHSGPLPKPFLAHGYVFNLVLSGEADLFARGGTHRVGPGSVVLAEPAEVRDVRRRLTPVATTRSITLREQRFLDAARERGLRGPGACGLRRNVASDPRVADALRQLYVRIDGREPALSCDVALESVLDCVLASELIEGNRVRSATRNLYRARDYLDAHVEGRVTLNALSAVAALSRAQFVRAFRREFGLAPNQWQIARRIAKSRELLGRGMAISRVAVAMGFSDQSHFTRHFHRWVGVTPARYQRVRPG